MDALSLRQLRYFDALYRHRHFGKAAAECAVSQPALSMQIAALEALLGAALVERHRGRIVITPAGEDAARRARDILNAVSDMGDALRHGSRVLAGRMVLGVIPSLAPYVLPRILPMLHAQYPALDLIVRETQTEKLLRELDDATIDAALLSLPIDAPGIAAIELFDDPFLLAYHAEPHAPPRSSDDVLASERLLLLEEGHCLRDQALSFCSALAREDTEILGATSLFTIMQMVGQGYGATLLPQIAVESELRGHASIRTVRFAKPEPSRRIVLAHRAASPRAHDFEALARVTTQAIKKKAGA